MKKLFAILFMLTMLFSASALAEEVILPDPGHYFGRSYDGFWIEFDEYPKEEFDAYTTLLIEVYGMEISDEHVGKYGEEYFLTIPGVARNEAFVACCHFNDGTYGIQFDFSKNITLSALEVYTPDAKVNEAHIVSNDGLSVMSPEQYLGIEPCDQIYQQDNYYVYKYIDRGFEKYGKEDKNLEDWYAMADYLNALIDSGYYKIIEHTISSTNRVEYWCLGYTGAKTIKVFGANKNSTQEAAILIQSHYGDICVRYSVDILTDDLDETQMRLGENLRLDDPAPSPDDPYSILETCDVCNGDRKCRYCWGKGTDITGGDCAVCNGGNCSACGGSGHK